MSKILLINLLPKDVRITSKDNVERVLETAEQFPIFLWQLSVAKVMCHPIYIESFQREPPIKIYRASDGGHKKVLSPISRLILWIMEATVTGVKSIEVFHWIWYFQSCASCWIGVKKENKKNYCRVVQRSLTLKYQCSVFCLVFGSALQTASWHSIWKKPSNEVKTHPSRHNPILPVLED